LVRSMINCGDDDARRFLVWIIGGDDDGARRFLVWIGGDDDGARRFLDWAAGDPNLRCALGVPMSLRLMPCSMFAIDASDPAELVSRLPILLMWSSESSFTTSKWVEASGRCCCCNGDDDDDGNERFSESSSLSRREEPPQTARRAPPLLIFFEFCLLIILAMTVFGARVYTYDYTRSNTKFVNKIPFC
jgi:hypothetical protein